MERVGFQSSPQNVAAERLTIKAITTKPIYIPTPPWNKRGRNDST